MAKRCPHCGAWAPCNDADGRVAAYMARTGRAAEWNAVKRKRDPVAR